MSTSLKDALHDVWPRCGNQTGRVEGGSDGSFFKLPFRRRLPVLVINYESNQRPSDFLREVSADLTDLDKGPPLLLSINMGVMPANIYVSTRKEM